MGGAIYKWMCGLMFVLDFAIRKVSYTRISCVVRVNTDERKCDSRFKLEKWSNNVDLTEGSWVVPPQLGMGAVMFPSFQR